MGWCDCFYIFAVEFVSAVDRSFVPISPIYPVFKRGDGEWVAKDVR